MYCEQREHVKIDRARAPYLESFVLQNFFNRHELAGLDDLRLYDDAERARADDLQRLVRLSVRLNDCVLVDRAAFVAAAGRDSHFGRRAGRRVVDGLLRRSGRRARRRRRRAAGRSDARRARRRRRRARRRGARRRRLRRRLRRLRVVGGSSRLGGRLAAALLADLCRLVALRILRLLLRTPDRFPNAANSDARPSATHVVDPATENQKCR